MLAKWIFACRLLAKLQQSDCFPSAACANFGGICQRRIKRAPVIVIELVPLGLFVRVFVAVELPTAYESGASWVVAWFFHRLYGCYGISRP